MANRRARAVLLMTACLLALGACTVAPRGKTLRLPTPTPSVTAKPASPGVVGLKRGITIRLEDLDQAGYFYGGMQLVFGWLDNDHLAALGTKPIAQGTGAPTPAMTMTPEERKILQDKLIEAKRISAEGIVGQILSVDWQTQEATELHTVQDEVITGMGLSHDRSRLWYISTDGRGVSNLSVSDISFKHDMMSVPDYSGTYLKWSSQDKYLYYINYNAKTKKSNPPLTLFDFVSTRDIINTEITYGGPNLIGIDDETGRVNSIIKDSAVVSVSLADAIESPDIGVKASLRQSFDRDGALGGQIYQAVWMGSDYVLMMCAGKEATSLGILDIAHDDAPYWYDGVLNFAVSDDGKYVCLVKEASGNTADVYVAEWKDGALRGETMLYKGFIATDAIYFNPDSTKLYLQGRHNYADNKPIALVLQFR
jgi:hypothetical protein